MPIYEYQCTKCGNVHDMLFKNLSEAEKYDDIDFDYVSVPTKVHAILCNECGKVCRRIMSAPNFRVTGFNAKNGYNLPNYNDVIDADGHAKKEWGKNK